MHRAQDTGHKAQGTRAALVETARSPVKFKMDVSDVIVVDRPGYLARSMIINPTGKRVEEHIYASECKGEMIYRVVDPQTKCETDDERVIAVKEGPLHGVSIVTSQMASRVLEGASGLGEADAQENGELCSQQRRQGK